MTLEQIRAQGWGPGEPATRGVFGLRVGSLDFYPGPKAKAEMFSQRTLPLDMVSLNVKDPILQHIYLLKQNREGRWIRTGGRANSLFVQDQEGNDPNYTRGVLLTPEAIKYLGYEDNPEKIEVSLKEGKREFLPVLGIVDWLPLRGR